MKTNLTKNQEWSTTFQETQALENADRILNHQFLFDRRWDMERCKTAYTLNPIDWLAQPNQDEEWCFMLNRMDYLKDLVLAFQMTRQHKYLIAVKELLLDWCQQHSPLESNLSTRTLDTGIRLLNMYEVLPHLLQFKVLQSKEYQVILDSMKAQALYLIQNYKTKYTLSNWGSIQIASLVIVLELWEDLEPQRRWSKEELQRQLAIQVYPDGQHWEQSTMYHVEVLNAFQRLYYYGNLEQALKTQLQDTLHKMTMALVYLQKPNQKIEAYGDSDEVYVKDVLLRSAYLLHQPSFLEFVDEVDGESFFFLGEKVRSFFQNEKKEYSFPKIYDGKFSGIYTIRNNWSSRANYLSFLNSSLGSAHGHSDNLHLSLSWQGKDVLIDPGRYSYREDEPLRPWLKSQYSHNSLVIDEQPFSNPLGSWDYQSFAIIQPTYVHHEGTVHYLEGTIFSNSFQVWTRKILFLEEGACLVMDEVRAAGKHRIHQYFHFDSSIHSLEEIQWTHDGKLLVSKEVFSREYNSLEDHIVATIEHQMTDFGHFLTFFGIQGSKIKEKEILQGNQKALAKDQGEAYEVTLPNQESYIFIVLHEEIYHGTKLLFCDGIPFHAKCVVIHNSKVSILRSS